MNQRIKTSVLYLDQIQLLVQNESTHIVCLFAGIEVPHSLKVDLLELLCFYNSADPPIPPQPLENLHRTQDMTYRFKTDRNWR